MALPWLRLYHEFAVDPHVQVMPECMQRRLIMVFCFMQSGDLDKLDQNDLAKAMNITPQELVETKKVFLKKKLINENWHPVRWKSRQHPDLGAAERMRNMRRNRAVTSPVTNSEQDRNSHTHTHVDGYGDVKERVIGESVRGEREETIEEEQETHRNVTEALRPCYGNVTGTGNLGNLEASVIPGPEFDQLGDLAIELSKDLSLGSWVLNMARLGYTVAMVRFALEQGASSGQWAHQWLHGVLKRVAANGIPLPPKGKGEPVQAPPKPKPVVTQEQEDRINARFK